MLQLKFFIALFVHLIIESSVNCCEPAYTCVAGTNNFISFGQELPCEAGFICNKNNVEPCNPCIESPCNTLSVICHSTIHDVVQFPFQYKCPTGLLCNADLVEPCTICISNSTAITTTTTTTTTVSPIPTENPNCADGNGATDVCRKGPLSPTYYYKCQPVMWWWEYAILPCSNVANDTICTITTVCN